MMGLSISVLILTFCRFCHSYPFNLVFINGSETLNYYNDQMAIAYDIATDEILLLGGGRYERQLMLFKHKAHHFFDGGRYFLDYAIDGKSQYYTQLNNELWIIRPSGGFIQFNTETHAITLPNTTIPNNATQSCLTATQDHIFVIGSKWFARSVYIYDINDNEWLSGVPSLISDRNAISCAVVNNKVYAIGGNEDTYTQHNTIEVLNITSIGSISSKTWEYMKNALTSARQGTTAVVYGTDIFVVGGYYYDNGYYYISDVNVIDTVTDECRSVGDLTFGTRYASSIIVDNILYVFGGETACCGDDNRYQYASLPMADIQTTSLLISWGQQRTVTEYIKDNLMIVIIVSVCACCILTLIAFYFGNREFENAQKYRHSVSVMRQKTSLVPGIAGNNSKTSNKDDARAQIEIEPIIAQRKTNHRNQRTEDKLKVDEFIVRSDIETDYMPSPKADSEGEGCVGNKDGAKEVKLWLDAVGGSIYYDRFIQNGFNAMELIKEINDVNDLNRIGIPLKAQQLKIMNHIKKLKL